jgi:hypothetical protein
VDFTLDEFEHLAAVAVDAEEPWRPIEAAVGEVNEQCLNDLRIGSTASAYGVADTDHRASRRGSTPEYCVAAHVGVGCPKT